MTALYVYDIRRADGVAPAFEAHEFRSDADALRHAPQVLGEHLSCRTVAIWCDGRLVDIYPRPQAAAG